MGSIMTATANNGDRQAILDKLVDNKKVFGTSFVVKHNGEIWQGSAGNISSEQPYFIASTTKLFVTSIILNLQSKGLLKLEDPISKYLDSSIVNGLNNYKGRDYSYQITVRHLMAHTSGIPDYFQDKGQNKTSLENDLSNGKDAFWTFEQAVERSKAMNPLFPPETKGKAHYSDTNFQLLGKIIESITHRSFSENCDEHVIKPLGMSQTYLYQDDTDKTPITLYYKNRELHIPKAMTSFGPDGGIVSTSSEMMVFIEAFFTGKLFPKAYISDLLKWNRIFFPMESGIGLHRFKLLKIFNPTGAIPEIIGHSGLSGAMAFYSPEKDLYIVGTVNQVANRDISFKTAIKLIQKTLHK